MAGFYSYVFLCAEDRERPNDSITSACDIQEVARLRFCSKKRSHSRAYLSKASGVS